MPRQGLLFQGKFHMKLNFHGSQQIILPRDPIHPYESATKNYVDLTVGGHADNALMHLTEAQKDWISTITVSAEVINRLSGLSGSISDELASKLSLTGGVMTGAITLPADPSQALHAATKQYVDARFDLALPKTGGTLSGALTLPGDPVSVNHATTKGYVDGKIDPHVGDGALHLGAGQRDWLDAVTVSTTEINRLSGVQSNVQDQIDARVRLDGGTMTGALSLSGAPTSDAHAATKQYVDEADVLKLNKAGDTMTGALSLPADPTANLHAATKQYVDSGLTEHATDASLHLTAAQDAWIDAVTATSTEVNQLVGTTDNVQGQIDAKFDRAGGLVSGDVTLAAGKAVFVAKTPTADTELANKAYVDARVKGQEWKDPVTAIDVVSLDRVSVPAEPVEGLTYILGLGSEGVWVGMDGYAVTYANGAWKYLQGRPVAAGDRFAIATTAAGILANDPNYPGLVGKVITIINARPGELDYTEDTITPGSSILVFDEDAPNFGVTYTYTDENKWTPTNTSVNISPGAGLALDGKLLNVQTGAGLVINDNKVQVALDAAGAIRTTVGGDIAVRLDGETLTTSNDGLRLNAALASDIADGVRKSTDTTVTANLTIGATGTLSTTFAPTQDTHAVNKGFVEGLVTPVDDRVQYIETQLGDLIADPLTKVYVDTEIGKKLSKAGDAMAGFLTLHAAPNADMHAANKQYVDSNLTSHSSDDALHMTAEQNTWLDAVTATAAEVNHLSGTTDNVQFQIGERLRLDGGTLTGGLTLAADPTTLLHAATKQYVDGKDALALQKAGGVMTGAIVLPGAPTADLHASTKKYVDDSAYAHATNESLHMTSEQNAWIDAITATATELNHLSGITANVQGQINDKLELAGGTMTGALVLNGAPTADMQAANRKYVDDLAFTKLTKAGGTMTGPLVLAGNPAADAEAVNLGYLNTRISAEQTTTTGQVATRVAKTGDTMTGPLVLPGAPTQDLQAATKLYVDDAFSALEETSGAAVTTLIGQVGALRSDVDTLQIDPVTRQYVIDGLAEKIPKAGGSMSGYLVLSNDPVSPLQAATKQYVDAIAQGLTTKPSVRLATTSNLLSTYSNGTGGVNATLIATMNGALIVDGVLPNVGDRILVKSQTARAENGDYIVQQVGSAGTPYALKRVTLVDESHEVPGSYFYVFDGATLKGTGWVFNVEDPMAFLIGVNDIEVNQFSGQGTIRAGNGISLDGNTISVKTASNTRIVVSPTEIDLATTGVAPGTYNKLVVDAYGRVTSGVAATSFATLGLVDVQPLNDNLSAVSAVETSGLLVRRADGTVRTRSLNVSGGGLSISNKKGDSEDDITVIANSSSDNLGENLVLRDIAGNFSANTITAALAGNATTATRLQNARTINVTGDVSATAVSFDGSANVSLNAELSNTGVVAGTYTKVTVDAKGRLSLGENPTTVAGYGIIDAYTIAQMNTKIEELQAQFQQLHAYVLSRI